MLRPIPIIHYLAAMRARGWSDAALLAETGIEPALLDDPDYMICERDHHAFLANMIRISGDQGLGLDMGLAYEAIHSGVLAHTGLSCRTIRHGLEVLARYGGAFGSTTMPTVVSENHEIAVVEFLAPRITEASYRFSIERVLAVIVKLGRTLIGPEPPFLKLTVAYPKPHYDARYAELFGCPIEFDTARTCATIAQSWLNSPLKTCDPELNRLGREHLNRVSRQTDTASTITSRLRQVILRKIGQIPSIAEVASEFGMSSRTLARHLEGEGYSYRSLTEELRCEMAKTWMRSSRMPVKEIGFRLGFRDIAAFRRAFKGWTGQTIGGYCKSPGATVRVGLPGRQGHF